MAPDAAQCICSFNDIRVPRRNYIDSAKRTLPRHMRLYLAHFLPAPYIATFCHSPSHCSIEQGMSMGRAEDVSINSTWWTFRLVGWKAMVNEKDK